VTNLPQNDDRNTLRSDRLERYKVRIGLVQAIAVTLITGGVAVAIPASVDAYRAYLDRQKVNREFDIKLLEIRNSYTSSFLSQSINQDIELRLRLSEYFSYVADEGSRQGWKDFYIALDKRRDVIRQKIKESEARVDQLSVKDTPTLEEQIELADLERELNWYYTEVGYLRIDTNVTVPKFDPAPPQQPRDYLSRAPMLESMFAATDVDKARLSEVNALVDKIVANKSRYAAVSDSPGVPWYFLATIHALESSLNFARHLHNGDPLTDRTVTVPKGRPIEGTPPFTWEQGAVDVVAMNKLDQAPAVTAASQVLHRLEVFNGLGYLGRNIPSPYLWACTNHEKPGVFVRDGLFDANGFRRGCGAAAILRVLVDRGEVHFDSAQVSEN